MRYSLVNRFQGCWVGSMLGEALSQNMELAEKLRISQYAPPSWLNYRDLIARALISRQELSPIILEITSDSKSNLTSDRLCLLLLPLIIFSADNLTLLANTLLANNSYLNTKEEELEDALVWGCILALILREKLNIDDFIEIILAVVEVPENSLIKQLAIVRIAIKQSQTIDYVVKKLSKLGNPSQTSLALSLYFWGFTPENYNLTIQRAIKAKYRLKYTPALTGALAGAHNGFTGISTNWRTLVDKNSVGTQAKIMATKLFDTWSGIYLTSSKIDLAKGSQTKDLINSVAAVGTIQTRPQLNIISQTKY